MGRVLVAVLLIASALAAVVAPVATYTVTLAVFGLPHVLAELRYVDRRFASAVPGPVVAVWAALLAAIVVERLLQYAKLMPHGAGAPIELALVGALAASAAWVPTERGQLARAAAVAVSGAIGVGLIVAPVHLLLILALLHNLTPLGFLAERLDGPGRGVDLGLAIAAMIGVPLLIATGLPWQAASALGLDRATADPLGVGPLSGQLSAYLHPRFHAEWWASQVFRAAVFGQCAHYIATIGILPRLLPDEQRDAGRIAWPGPVAFGIAVAAMTIPLIGSFTIDFARARSLYAIVAAVHAFVEFPVLIVAIGGARRGLHQR